MKEAAEEAPVYEDEGFSGGDPLQKVDAVPHMEEALDDTSMAG